MGERGREGGERGRPGERGREGGRETEAGERGRELGERERGRPGERGREAADVNTLADVDTTRAPTGLNFSPCQRLG